MKLQRTQAQWAAEQGCDDHPCPQRGAKLQVHSAGAETHVWETIQQASMGQGMEQRYWGGYPTCEGLYPCWPCLRCRQSVLLNEMRLPYSNTYLVINVNILNFIKIFFSRSAPGFCSNSKLLAFWGRGCNICSSIDL